MKIAGALTGNRILVLDLPLQGKFLPRNYHAWIDDQGQFTCDVKYGGEYVRREPFVASADWADFFRCLPPVCQDGDEWQVLHDHKK